MKTYLRKKDQSVIIREDIVVTIIDIIGDRVRLGITYPKGMPLPRTGRGDAEFCPDEEESVAK